MKCAIYCRVSTEDQTLEQQEAVLVEYCQDRDWDYEVFSEKVSGAKESRTELDRLMQGIRNKVFDRVLILKLDRLGRSLRHLLQLIEEFNNKNVQFICLSPQVDTKSAQGRFFIQIMGAVAELEREFGRERTREKLQHLKRMGVKLGRPVGAKDKKPRKKLGYFLRGAKKVPPKPL